MLRQYISTDAGRIQFDRFKLSLPLVGDLIRKREIAKLPVPRDSAGNGVQIPESAGNH